MSRARKILALGLLAGFTLGVIAGKAHAGFDHPFKHTPLEKRAAEGAIPGRHCSKVGNPFECSQDSARPPHGHGPPDDPYSDHSCQWLRVMYEYHHAATGKPRALQGFYGCALWRRDAAYHDSLRRLGIDDDTQELFERLATNGVAALFQNPIQGDARP